MSSDNKHVGGIDPKILENIPEQKFGKEHRPAVLFVEPDSEATHALVCRTVAELEFDRCWGPDHGVRGLTADEYLTQRRWWVKGYLFAKNGKANPP